VAAVAVAVGEGDVLSEFKLAFQNYECGREGETNLTRVNSQAIILVIDGSPINGNISTGANVKRISVMALAGTSRVVDGDTSDGEVVGLDAEALNRGVVHLEPSDVGLVQLVRVEELGLGLAAVATLGVPPAGAVAVDLGAGLLLDGDGGSGDRDQGALPLFVAEGGFSLEDDLSRGLVGIMLVMGVDVRWYRS
jgi:hypothetical protein